MLYFIIGGTTVLIALLIFMPPAIVSNRLLHPLPIPPGEVNLSLNPEEITFPGRKNLPAKGWLFPLSKPGMNWIILVHGYHSNRQIFQEKEDFPKLISKLHDRGFNVMTFDFINAGNSAKDMTSVGYYEQEDLHSAIDFLKSCRKEAVIGTIGWSMGAATALLVAARRKDLSFVIADSAFSDLKRYLKTHLKVWTGLPSFYNPLILKMIESKSGLKPELVSPENCIREIQCPVLLLHNEYDKSILPENAERIWNRANKNSTLKKILPEEGHSRGFSNNPDSYFREIDSFLKHFSLI